MTTPDHNRSPGHRDAFPDPPATPAEAAIAAEAARYGRIFSISYNAVLDAIGAGNWPGPAADRAATWFAGRMTDRRLAGAGLDNLNAMLDAEASGAAAMTMTPLPDPPLADPSVKMLLPPYGGDLLVLNAAGVSYDNAAGELSERGIDLIRKLADNGHTSPFYHPVVTFRIKANIIVARQLHRHQVGLALNELSRRYTSRGIEFERTDDPVLLELYARCYAAYKTLIARGMHREDARRGLPLALMTTWVWTGSLYAWANLCRQRIQPDVQAGTRHIAELIADRMTDAFPVSWPALRNAAGGY